MRDMKEYYREFDGCKPLDYKLDLYKYGEATCVYTGTVLTQAEVDCINVYKQEFNRLRYRAEQEFMLDQCHRMIVTICQDYLNRQQQTA